MERKVGNEIPLRSTIRRPTLRCVVDWDSPLYKSVHCLGFQNAWEEATHGRQGRISGSGTLFPGGASSRSRRFGGKGVLGEFIKNSRSSKSCHFPVSGKIPAHVVRRPWPSGQEGWLRGRQPPSWSKKCPPPVSPLIDTCQHPVKLDVGIQVVEGYANTICWRSIDRPAAIPALFHWKGLTRRDAMAALRNVICRPPHRAHPESLFRGRLDPQHQSHRRWSVESSLVWVFRSRKVPKKEPIFHHGLPYRAKDDDLCPGTGAGM